MPPNPADLLSEQDDEDPDDQLRMQLDQGQGANLAGGPQPPGAPSAMPPPGAPSPNVPGPLAALAQRPTKPRIKLKPPPKVKKAKPKIRPKPAISPLQGYLNAIGQ